MKILFILALVFASAGSSAQCFNHSETIWVKACGAEPDVDPFGQYGQCPVDTEYFDISGSLLLSDEPQETCSGLWIESGVTDDSHAVVASVKNLEKAFNEGVLAIVLALACVCFFVGLNSWEPAAK